jgi:hypothetical protein
LETPLTKASVGWVSAAPPITPAHQRDTLAGNACIAYNDITK